MNANETNEVRNEDKPVLVGILRNASRLGSTLADLAADTGFTAARIAAVAKRYEGRRFRGGVITYVAPQSGSFKSACPGIKNPRTGISGRVPAEVFVTR
jgi:hypothetical protein